MHDFANGWFTDPLLVTSRHLSNRVRNEMKAVAILVGVVAASGPNAAVGRDAGSDSP